MTHSELPWKVLTEQLYAERFVPTTRGEDDEIEAARLWTEAARRVKVIARKGFRRTIPACDLEDIEQRVLLKLLDEHTLRSATCATSPGVYISRMIYNEVMDHLRRQVRESLFISVELDEKISAGSNNFEFENAAVRELFTRLESGLEALPSSAREVLARRFWEGADIHEIATDLNLPYSTVAKRLFRAVAKLRERFDHPNA